MEKLNLSKAKSKKEYKVGDVIHVSDFMQKGYSYKLSEPIGKNYDAEFKPELTPPDMLKLGVFEGHYLNDCHMEFPKEWFENARPNLSPSKPDINCNYFKIKSRQPLYIWLQKGWIKKNDPDVRGWFQWYARYYLGRRNEKLDKRQIKRWRAFKRHKAQIINNCKPGDFVCRPRQRQALLQWAYNPFI